MRASIDVQRILLQFMDVLSTHTSTSHGYHTQYIAAKTIQEMLCSRPPCYDLHESLHSATNGAI